MFILEVNDSNGKDSILVRSVVQPIFSYRVYSPRIRIIFYPSALYNGEKPKRK